MSTEQQSGATPEQQPPTDPFTVIEVVWLERVSYYVPGDPEYLIALPDAEPDEPWHGVFDGLTWDLSREHVSWRVVATPTAEKEPTDGTPHE